MESTNKRKERPGSVTGWLMLLIISNLFIAFIYLIGNEKMPGVFSTKGMSYYLRILFSLIAIGNVICVVLLLQWKKWGFWGIVILWICVFAIKVFNGAGVIQSISGLFGIAMLYGILQIRKNNISAWVNLD